ncbi:MAG: BMP family ABC transporter substrate-binding protein [Actinomycetota bacterium]
MDLRALGVMLSFVVLVAGCGGDAEQAVTDEPPTDLAAVLPMAEIVDTDQMVDAGAMELDELCAALYADVPIASDASVGLVADVAAITDGTFNQYAFEGMEAAGRCFGVLTGFLESAGNDAEEQIGQMVDRDLDIIVTVGFQFAEATAAAAEANPGISFIGIDQTNPTGIENLIGITFRDDQVGYLAGVAAASLSETGTVGIVAGPDTVPPVVAIADGFEAAVAATDPNVSVLRTHLDTFADPQLGAEEGARMLDAGADVLFGAAGPTGTGAIMSAAAAGTSVIGVDQDQYFTSFAGGAEPHADRLVTSAVKRVDLGVFLTVAALTQGAVAGGDFQLDAANGGVTYAPFHEAEVSADVADALEAARRGLADNTIDLTDLGSE